MDMMTNAYNRLSEIMAYLMSDSVPEGVSVYDLSRMTDIPVDVAARDILAITGDKHIKGSFYLQDEADINVWRQSIKDGETKALDKKLRIDKDLFLQGLPADVVAVNLTPFEKNIFASAADPSYFSGAVRIKKPVFAGDADVPRILGPLQMAIEQGHTVSFMYGNEGRNEGFIPRSIYTDQFNKKKYLAGTYNCVGTVLRRIDHIKELKVHSEENVPPLKEGELDILDHIWGGDIYPEEIKITALNDKKQEIRYDIRHVKIKIFKETGNIYEKIKTETNGRRFGRLYEDPEDEDIACYEDDVCGMGSFKKWLLGYGASVMVLEPYELAEDMYRLLRRRLKRYKENL